MLFSFTNAINHILCVINEKSQVLTKHYYVDSICSLSRRVQRIRQRVRKMRMKSVDYKFGQWSYSMTVKSISDMYWQSIEWYRNFNRYLWRTHVLGSIQLSVSWGKMFWNKQFIIDISQESRVFFSIFCNRKTNELLLKFAKEVNRVSIGALLHKLFFSLWWWLSSF